MKTWTETNYCLTPHDMPIVTSHDDAVSLHLSGFRLDSRGFSLRFMTAHLPVLRELCQALEALQSQEPLEPALMDSPDDDLDNPFPTHEHLLLDFDEEEAFGPGNPDDYGDST